MPPSLNLFTDENVAQTIAVVGQDRTPIYAPLIQQKGGAVLSIPEKDGHLDLAHLLLRLGQMEKPIQSILVEGGSQLSTAFLAQKLGDKLSIFIAPKLIGQGLPSIMSLGINTLADALTFSDATWEQVGGDMLFSAYLNK